MRSMRNRKLGLALVVSIFGSITVAACGDDDVPARPSVTNDGGGGDANITPPIDGGNDSGPPARTKFTRPSHGSPIDISEDDAIVVAANTDVGTVSVFDVTYSGTGAPPTLTKKAEVQVCAEPTSVALNPAGDRAYVLCRKDQKLVRVDSLRGTPGKGTEVTVGSEPTGLALTPKATKAWVTNWMDGTAMEIDANTMAITATVDLNAALVATGALGTVTSRPSLAHPRGIAITNNNDDLENDESVLVTEFFAQTKEPLTEKGSNADIARQGYVYKINPDKTVTTIALAPLADMGFKDSAGADAGCFPNQISSINVNGSFAYVLSVCASPKGPLGAIAGGNDCTVGTQATDCGFNGTCNAGTLKCNPNPQNVKTVVGSLVNVIDVGGNKVVASVPLNKEFTAFFDTKMRADDGSRRLPLSITDIGFVPGTINALIPARGSDAVYRVHFNATYATQAVDSVASDKDFIKLDLGLADATKNGSLPVGITVAHRSKLDAMDRFAFVLNEATRNVSVIDMKTDQVAGVPDAAAVVSSTPMPTDPTQAARLEGKKLFSTGLGRWSLRGQAWIACESCHWDGLSDQVTWFHVRGPRQTPSIDQTVNKKDVNHLRAGGWQAFTDELADFELGGLRLTTGGVGSIVKNTDLVPTARIPFDTRGHAGLDGSARAAADPLSPSSAVGGEVCVLDDWKELALFMQSIRTPRKPTNLDSAKVTEGKTVFEAAKCQGCHSGDLWTISKVFYTPDGDVTPGVPSTDTNAALNTASWKTDVETAAVPIGILPAEDLTDGNILTMRSTAGTGNKGGFDSLMCLLRHVNTYGKAEAGVAAVFPELRRDHTSPAQGAGQGAAKLLRGYNVPSLLGVGANAPYLHSGGARTLEALLTDTFTGHHNAIVTTFLDAGDTTAATKRAALVQFLLSIDVDTAVVATPTLGADGGDFCKTP